MKQTPAEFYAAKREANGKAEKKERVIDPSKVAPAQRSKRVRKSRAKPKQK
jgi:hypothetical protein